MSKAILGTKLGMSQVFAENGDCKKNRLQSLRSDSAPDRTERVHHSSFSTCQQRQP